MRQFTIKGLGVSPGIAFGTAHFIDDGTIHAPLYRISQSAVKAEYRRFNEALAATDKGIDSLQRASRRKLPSKAAEEICYILQAHGQMLRSGRLLEGIKRRIAVELINAEAAVAKETESIAADFAQMPDPYLAARGKDISELGSRLIAAFAENGNRRKLRKDSILLAKVLDPASAALLDPQTVVGIAAQSGGADSHTAIVARAMQMPSVLGAESLDKINDGDELILDGSAGKIVVHPTAAAKRLYRQRRKKFASADSLLPARSRIKAKTKDGIRIGVYANIELPGEAKNLIQSGAEGVGLLRSEFLFMNRSSLPDEAEQYDFIKQVVKQVGKSPVVVRTLDIGGDKLAPVLGGAERNVGNPALGLRAIRLSLKYPGLFKVQIAAILRAAALADQGGQVRILLPMISSVSEIIQSRKLIGEVHEQLLASEIVPKQIPPLGIMIETPSAVLLADEFAKHCDFFAIGTNDLTMYTLAIDRDNEEVAPLYDPLHPALLRMIQLVGQAGWDHGIRVSICGEIAADINCTALLVGLGMTEFSMAPNAIARVKDKLSTVDSSEARRMAKQVLDTADPKKIKHFLDSFNSAS